jgi:hypothetical protein
MTNKPPGMEPKPPVRQRTRSLGAEKPKRQANGRFGPGFCGNRKGRPKKQPDNRSPADRVFEAEMTVNKNGRAEKITAEQALYEVIISAALQRDPQMMPIAARLLQERLRRPPRRSDTPPSAVAPSPSEGLTPAERELVQRYLNRKMKTE